MRVIDEIVNTVVETTSGGRGTAVNTTLKDRLASDASERVQVAQTDRVGECVGDPGHFTFTSAHIRGFNKQIVIVYLVNYYYMYGTWDVNAWSNKALLGELNGQTTSDSLQLVFGIFLGVDFNTGFATT